MTARYAVWVELLVIHLLVPRSSFAGHLAGILVGLLYTCGPLKTVVDLLDWALCLVLSCGSGVGYRQSFSRRRDSDFLNEQPTAPSYTQPEENYQTYSRDDFTSHTSFQDYRSSPHIQRRSDIGWNIGQSYTYAHGAAFHNTGEILIL